MSGTITLTTDFGYSEYVAAMKGVVLSINPEVRIIDISHAVRPQDIVEGAYVLFSTARFFSEAIHVGVVDPGVGTDRAGLIMTCQSGILVGPDNGLLVPAARALGLKKAYRISNRHYMLEKVSSTFHGRDIFAPVAAHLSKGTAPEEMGSGVVDYVDLTLEYHREEDSGLRGKIIHVDGFGNIITSIPGDIILRHFGYGDPISIEGGSGKENVQMRFLESYGYADPGEMLATISSSGFFEISLNSGSARRKLGAWNGDAITIHLK